MRFIITGGHHNSALVVAKHLLTLGHQVEWVGHRYAAQGDRHDSAEYIEVKAAGIPFHELKAGKSTLSPSNLVNTPLGFLQAAKLLSRLKPQAVLSFGGYLGLTVSLVAVCQSIPIFLHEQTAIAGKANKVMAHLARRIYLTWDSSRAFYPAVKTLTVGLPLRPAFIQAKARKLFKNNKPTLLFLCGKQGSHTINKLIFANLENLLSKYNLIHQTGTSSATGDYEKAVALQESFPSQFADSYQPYGYIGEDEVAAFMKSADLVVGRSGAHTTYELGVLGKKCLLIPFMATHGFEQLHNARALEQAKIASILPQSELSFPRLDQGIIHALARVAPKPLNLPLDADQKLTADMLRSLAS